MRCLYCKGSLEDRQTNFIVDLGECIMIIKNVPSQVCSQCGEVSYSNEVAKKLEAVVERMRSMVRDVAVFEYSKIVA